MTDAVFNRLRVMIEDTVDGEVTRVERHFGEGERITVYRVQDNLIRVDIIIPLRVKEVTP